MTLQTRCSSSHVLIPPSLSGGLSHSTHLVFSSFRDNECSGVGSQMHHCRKRVAGLSYCTRARACLNITVATGLPTQLPLTDQSKHLFHTNIRAQRLFLKSVTHCSNHLFLQLNYLIHVISNSWRAWALPRDAGETVSGFYQLKLYTHTSRHAPAGQVIDTPSIDVSVSVAPGFCHVWQRQSWCFCWACERHRPARLTSPWVMRLWFASQWMPCTRW